MRSVVLASSSSASLGRALALCCLRFFLFRPSSWLLTHPHLADSADDRIGPSAAAEEDNEGDHGEHGGQGDRQEPLRHLRCASLLQRGAAVQRIPIFNVLVKLAGHQSDRSHYFRSDRLLCAHWPLLVSKR